VETYDDGTGAVGLIGSFERLELAVPGGSAARKLDVVPGTELTITQKERVNR
jgi:S-adenosylmethionine hydrolase